MGHPRHRLRKPCLGPASHLQPCSRLLVVPESGPVITGGLRLARPLVSAMRGRRGSHTKPQPSGPELQAQRKLRAWDSRRFSQLWI